jgi:hypothetical protein
MLQRQRDRRIVMTKQEQIRQDIHEVADTVINWGGYAEDETEQARRSDRRDKLEAALLRVVIQHDNETGEK